MNDTQGAPSANRPSLRLRDCYWFFGPLVLMVELNMMSKSVIHGFLARTDNPDGSTTARVRVSAEKQSTFQRQFPGARQAS